MRQEMNSSIVFDLKGLIKIQVEGANEKDLISLSKFFGASPTIYTDEADITIQFVEDLAPKKMKFLGTNQFGFTDKDFFLLNPSSGEVYAKIPIDQIGKKCEIVCSHGVTKIPLINEILKITLLQKDVLSLHASAIEYDHKGIVIMGWARGGKTSSLLAFIQDGAKFVADDWVLYELEKNQVCGFPGKLSISDYHLRQMPNHKNKIRFIERLFLWSKAIIVYLLNIALKVFHITSLQKFAYKLNGKLRINLYPEDLLTPEKMIEYTTPGKFLLLTSHNQEEYIIQKTTADEMVDVFIHANECEFFKLYEAYQAFRFAFPDRKNLYIEDRIKLEERLLKKALASKELFRVFHPYPFPFLAFIEKVKL